MKEYAHILKAIAQGDAICYRSGDGSIATLSPEVVLELILKKHDPEKLMITQMMEWNDKKLPAPLRVAPEDGTVVFVALNAKYYPLKLIFYGAEDGMDWLERGLIHADKENAQMWIDAFAENSL